MKNRLLLGLSLAILFQFLYFAWSYRLVGETERPLNAVNRFHVPAVKLLSQGENGFLLLEADLDKALVESIPRPTAGLLALVQDRIRQLQKKSKEVPELSKDLQGGLTRLDQALVALTQRIEEFQKISNSGLSESESEGIKSDLSLARGAFRYELKSLNQLLETEIRQIVGDSQERLSHLLLVSLALVVIGILGGVIGVFWVSRAIAPLGKLARAARRISSEGMVPETLADLNQVSVTDNEVGVLVTEIRRMGASILDHSINLEEQKRKLQKAYGELAEQNEVLRAAQNKLLRQEKLSIVGKMSAQMAHEIRNPLNALGLHIDLLEEEWKRSPKLEASLAPVRREIQRLLSLTDGYLDLARSPSLKREEVSIHKVCKEVADLFQPLAKDKGIYLTLDLGPDGKVLGDEAQIGQVLSNLLKNAIESFEGLDFSEHYRSRPRYIRLITGWKASVNRVEVSVLDNGKGIDDQARDQIFSPFFTDKAKGNGLGLSFCRQVIEAMGGELSFDGAPGQGTKFTFSLPLKSVYAEEAKLQGGHNGETLPRPSATH